MALALAIGLLIGNSRAADWDELRGRVLSQFHSRLHWNNVSGPPIWVGGVPIKNSHLPKLSTVTLVPGESVELLVPADRFVRAFRQRGMLAPGDLHFWVSDGSGLQVRHAGFLSPDGQSLVTLPDHSQPALVRICRPETCLTPLTVALFVSYREDLGSPVSYRTLTCSPNTLFAIRREGSSLRRYHHVDPAHPISVRVVGPVRLKLETRLQYPPQEAQSRQSYRLRIDTDGIPLKNVDFETSAETDQQLCVENVPATLGRQQTGYVEIPPGPHQLTIDSTAPLFIRVLERDRPEWLLPGNRPALSSEAAEAWGYLFENRVSHWNLTPDDFAAVGWNACSTDGIPLLAFRSARDNSRPQGPLRAYFLLRALAALGTNDAELRRLAEEIRGRHTFFRDLIPVRTATPVRQRLRYFQVKQLLSPGESHHDVMVAEQHVDDFASRLPSGQFTELARTREQANVYRLPNTLGSTLLQVIVDRNSIRGTAPVFVQFDSGPVIALAATGSSELPPSRYSAGAVEAGLAAFDARNNPASAGTLGGPFAQLREPAPLISAGRAELVVPPGVSEIRVWSPTWQSGSTSAALRYLTSKPFHMTEMEYLDAARRAGVTEFGPSLFAAALQETNFISRDQYAEKELRNHWHPLLVWLRQENELFRRGLVDDQSDILGPLLPSAGESSQQAPSTAELVTSAKAYAESENWLPALEAWSDALPHLTGTTRREALFGRITALRQLGEDFLHETELRGLLLFDRDETVRAEAASRLARLYRQAGDDAALLRLQAVRTMADPSPRNLFELAQQLAADGRTDDALALALVIPRDDQVTRLILRTSFAERWWQHFDHAASQLSNPEEQHYWQAWRCLAVGNAVQVANHLQLAGQPGITLLNRLQEAEQIQTQLRSTDPVIRAQAVFQWERWSLSTPGLQVWSSAESAVFDYDSSALLTSPVLTASTQYYIGTSQRPVTLVIQGPVSLKIAGRPLHPPGPSQPIDDWMLIETDEQRLPVPINHNHVSDTVRFSDRPEFRPGMSVTEELTLGPGRHFVRVFGESFPLAVRVERQEPERQLPILPPVTTATVSAALNGSLGDVFYDPRCVRFVRVTSAAHPVGLRLPIPSADQSPLLPVPNPDVYPADIALRVLLRLGRLSHQVVESSAAVPLPVGTDCSPRERYSLLSRLGLPAEDAFQNLPAPVREGILWKAGRGPEAVALPLDALNVSAVRRRLSSYLRLFELDQHDRQTWLAQGEYCFRTHADLPGMRDIHTRLATQSEWKLTSQIESSAGLRTVPITGWQPESPFLRIRKTLIGPLDADEQILTGDQQLVLRLENDQPTRLRFTARLSQPPYVLPSSLTFAWQLDSGQEQQRELTPQRDRLTIPVDVPAGEHTIRLRCIEPWVNQFLRVTIVEESGRQDSAVQRDLNRIWNVSTDDEPLIVPLEGPVLVRIDEMHNGTTMNELRYFPQGLHRLELPPSGGREESLYRIYQLRYAPDQQPPRIQHREFPQKEAMSPFLADPAPFGLTLSGLPGDRLIPGILEPVAAPASPCPCFECDPGCSTSNRWLNVNHREDLLLEGMGIWSLGAGYFSRRPLVEGITGGKLPGKFFQVNLNHHRRFEEYNTWSETDLRFRERVLGGETLGITQTFLHDFEGSPWSLYLQGSGYLQHISEMSGGDWQGLIDLRGRLARTFELGPRTSHTPQITLFDRWLSLDYNPYRAGVIDQDVFTTFKRDQRYGLILADRFSHHPWLDTQWWFRPSLMTNEDFNVFKPDNMSATFGWEQWIRPVGLDLSYRLTGFFHDKDRLYSHTQQLITLEGFTEGWVWRKVRCEASVFLQHKLTTRDNSLSAVVTLTWDEGFNDWHYRPGEKDFQTVRNWRGAERRARPPLDWW